MPSSPETASQLQDHQSYLKLFVKGGGYVFLGHLFLHVTGFVYHFLLARGLGVAGYGILLVSLGIFQFLVLLSQMGFRWGLLRFLALAVGEKKPQQTRPYLLTSLLVGGLCGTFFMGGLLFFKEELSQRLGSSEYAQVLPQLAWGLPFAVTGVLLLTALQALKKITASVFLQKILEPLLKIILMSILFGLLGRNVRTAAASFSASALLVFSLGLLLVWKSLPNPLFPFQTSWRQTALKPLIFFSLPLLLSDLTNYCLQWSDTVLLGYFLSESSAGVYGAAFRWAAMGGMTLGALNYVFAPQIYELYGKRNTQEVRRLLQTVTRWLIIFNLPIFFILCFNSPWFLSIFGEDFQTGSVVLMILALGTLVNTGTGPVAELLYMAGRGKIIFYSSLFMGAFNVLANLWLIPRWGLLGAAWANASTILVSNLANIILGWTYTRIQPYTKKVLKPLAAATATALLLLALFHLDFLKAESGASLAVNVGIWAVLYPLFLTLFQWEPDDRHMWASLQGRLKQVMKV